MSYVKKVLLGLAIVFLSWQPSAMALNGEVWLDDYTSLSNAISSIGSDNVTLVVRVPCNVASDTTIPSNIAVRVIKGGKFKISTSYTLTINGNFEAQRFQVFSIQQTDSGYDGDVAFGSSSIKEVIPQWWGAKGDAVNDDTDALQKAIDSNRIGGPEVVFVPAGEYMVSNLTLPAVIKLCGEGRWSTTIKGKSDASGTMITDSGNAAKIIVTDMLLSCNNNSAYTEALKLGYNTYQFGTEGLIERLVIRDVPNGTGLAVDGNVGTISDISIWDTQTALRCNGNVNHLSRIYCCGFTGYGIENHGANFYYGVELEGPGNSSVPFYSTKDVFIHGLTVSLGDNANLTNSFIKFLPGNNVGSYFIDSIKLFTKTNPQYKAVVEHEGLFYGSQSTYSAYTNNMVFSNKIPQNTVIDDSFASSKSYYVVVPQTVPSTTFAVSSDLTQDMTISFSGVITKVQGIKHKVVNNSDKVVYVKGINALKVYLNPEINYDTSVGLPVRPKCYLEFEYAGQIGLAGVQGHISRPVMDLSAINSGKWWQGEIVYQKSNLIGSTNLLGKICVTTGDYSGTPPVWKKLPANN